MTAKKSFLEDRKIIVKPIIKAGGMNKEDHDGYFMYTGTEIQFVLPYSIKKGRLVTVLTKEEQAFFEEELDEDLSIHKKKDNFWHSFRIKLRKDEKLMSMGYELDLSDPIDNLKWRVLKEHDSIAPSWTDRNRKGSYKFALVDMDELVENKAKGTDAKKKAYIWFGGIENSKTKMRNFLRVYGNRPSDGATSDWLIGEIGSLIEDPRALKRVLSIIDDEDFAMKLFIEDAIEAGAIDKRTRKYYLPGGDPINENDSGLEGTVTALNKYKRDADEIYLRIEAQVKNNK